MHKNNINGKIYIGITSKNNPNYRWCNGNGYKGNKHFYNSIKKYGWENFSHIIKKKGLNKDEACKKEMYYIQNYKSFDPNFGYNISHGGEVVTIRNFVFYCIDCISFNYKKYEDVLDACKDLDMLYDDIIDCIKQERDSDIFINSCIYKDKMFIKENRIEDMIKMIEYLAPFLSDSLIMAKSILNVLNNIKLTINKKEKNIRRGVILLMNLNRPLHDEYLLFFINNQYLFNKHKNFTSYLEQYSLNSEF